MHNRLPYVLIRFLASVITCSYAVSVPFAVAQDYPSKPIKLIVATNPGTLGDTLARIVAPEVSKVLGQPVVVENKPGANSIIAYEYVAKQMPADGYTMVVVTAQGLPLLPLTEKELRFDPLKDLPPVIGIAETRFILGSSPGQPWKTFKEMVTAVKANPGKYNYGSANAQTRFPVLIIMQELGLDVAHIPYSGGGPFHTAMLSGEIQLGFTSASTGISFGEKLRILAVTGERRLPALPDVPTFRELGYPQVPGLNFTLNVRAGTPKAAIDKLYLSASRALQTPEVRSLLAKMSVDIVELNPDVAARRLADEAKLFADIAKKIGMQPR